jgi:hypothetical protein
MGYILNLILKKSGGVVVLGIDEAKKKKSIMQRCKWSTGILFNKSGGPETAKWERYSYENHFHQ